MMTTIGTAFTPTMFPGADVIKSSQAISVPAPSDASGSTQPPAPATRSSSEPYDPQAGSSTSPADPQMTEARMQEALKQLASSAINLDELGALIIEQANQLEKSALDDRLAMRQEAKSQLLLQASDELKAAAKMKSSALTALIVSVVTAAVSFALAGASAMKSMSAGRDLVAIKTSGSGHEAAPADNEPALAEPESASAAPPRMRSRVDPEAASPEPATTRRTDVDVDSDDDAASVSGVTVAESEPATSETASVTGSTPTPSPSSRIDADENSSVASSETSMTQPAADSDEDVAVNLPASVPDRAMAIKQVDLNNASAQNFSNTGNSVNQLGAAASSYISTTGQADSKAESAKGQAAGAEAQDILAQVDLAKEIQGSLEDMAKAVISFLQQINASKAEEMQSITRA